MFSLLLDHFFLLGPDVPTTLCVPSKSGVSVSPSPAKVLQSNSTTFQSLILQEFLLPLLDHQVWKPDMRLRTFTPVVGLLWYNCSPAVMGFDFIVITPLLQSHCSFFFVFGCGVSFMVSSSAFLSMTVQQLVVIPVLLQEGISAHPSTPPS